MPSTQDLQALLESIQQVDLLPLLLAIVLGGAIGFERQVHGRPAGLRTHILVCLASTILILAGRDLSEATGSLLAPTTRVVYDPNRLSAGIVTGIGFLGAAAVIRAGDLVRGITTGACVWSVAGLGVVIGQGEYGLAIISTGVFLIVLVVFDWLASPISPVIYRRLIVRGQRAELTALSRDVRKILKVHKIRVQDLHGQIPEDSSTFELVFNIRLRQRHQAPEMLELLANQEGVVSVEWSALAH